MDLYHGPACVGDYELHRSLVVDCIDMLCTFQYSVVAVKGANFLAALLRVTERRGSKRSHPDSAIIDNQAQMVDLSSVIRALDVNIPDGVARMQAVSHSDRHEIEGGTSSDGADYRIYPEMFPPQAGFCNQFLFKELIVLDS